MVVLAITLLGHARTSVDHAPGPPHGSTAADTLTFVATPTGAGLSLPAAVAQTAAILRSRFHSAFPDLRVRVASRGTAVTISLPDTG